MEELFGLALITICLFMIVKAVADYIEETKTATPQPDN
jgi:hypothetical protein